MNNQIRILVSILLIISVEKVNADDPSYWQVFSDELGYSAQEAAQQRCDNWSDGSVPDMSYESIWEGPRTDGFKCDNGSALSTLYAASKMCVKPAGGTDPAATDGSCPEDCPPGEVAVLATLECGPPPGSCTQGLQATLYGEGGQAP
ncbi:MAG: hypothetical protein KZQ77_15430, partial [Candidatus Thiodiazotropha sp. (ex Notomyrtea botanica)]|nr:hypothetical protein [Candidatus Thiodiazotropha sp. (ex Notomyrtea botanica)]